jgi:anti-sigma factor RsiW
MTDPHAELSAFLDGELAPARAREIEASIAADPDLRATYEQLQAADQTLKAIAETAAFRPLVRLTAQARPAVRAWMALPFAVVLVAWTVARLTPSLAAALVVNTAALFVFLACLAPLALREARTGEPSID